MHPHYNTKHRSLTRIKTTCVVCNRSVYPMEMIKIDEKPLHKTCLRCNHCSGLLKLGNYASIEGNFYCKPHFKQVSWYGHVAVAHTDNKSSLHVVNISLNRMTRIVAASSLR